MDPKVSVIIPTKNRAHYLSSAIQSVLDQTFRDFEIIVVDGASIDNTREVVAEFGDERITYIREKKDRGASASRNTGIKRSKGEFIAFLDDDDLWMPRKLEKQLNLINKNSDIGVVYTASWMINNSGARAHTGYYFFPLRGNIFSNVLEKNYIGNCSRMLVRKECFDRVGVFDEKLPAGEDWDMWIRLSKYYQFDYVNEPLVLYRIHEKRTSENPFAKIRAAKLMFKKISTHLNTSVNQRKILGYWHNRLGGIYCECGDMGKGRKEFRKAISKDPYSFTYYIRLFASFFNLVIYDALNSLLDSVLPAPLRARAQVTVSFRKWHETCLKKS
jgi:glycosyltransferase involved in cell wall biosynthesis